MRNRHGTLDRVAIFIPTILFNGFFATYPMRQHGAKITFISCENLQREKKLCAEVFVVGGEAGRYMGIGTQRLY